MSADDPRTEVWAVTLHDHFDARITLRVAQPQPQYNTVQMNAEYKGDLISVDVDVDALRAAIAKVDRCPAPLPTEAGDVERRLGRRTHPDPGSEPPMTDDPRTEACGVSPIGYAHRLTCIDQAGHFGRHTSSQGFQWDGSDSTPPVSHLGAVQDELTREWHPVPPAEPAERTTRAHVPPRTSFGNDTVALDPLPTEAGDVERETLTELAVLLSNSARHIADVYDVARAVIAAGWTPPGIRARVDAVMADHLEVSYGSDCVCLGCKVYRAVLG